MLDKLWDLIEAYVNWEKSWQAVDWMLAVIYGLLIWAALFPCLLLGTEVMLAAGGCFYLGVVSVSVSYKRRMGWRWPSPSFPGIVGAFLLAVPAGGGLWLALYTAGKSECGGVFLGLLVFDIFSFGICYCLGLAEFTLKEFDSKCGE